MPDLSTSNYHTLSIFWGKVIGALKGHAIHRWKALALLNPTMLEFKCVTRVSFELLPFKGPKLINISTVHQKEHQRSKIYKKSLIKLVEYEIWFSETKFHEIWCTNKEVMTL